MSTAASITPGDRVSLTLHLPKQVSGTEVAVATVRWAKDHVYGLAFRRISVSALSRMRKYMAVIALMESHDGGSRWMLQ